MADATRAAASARVSRFIPVEPGVSGKEKLFQQNRNFGPGPVKPYNSPEPPARRTGPHPIPSGGERHQMEYERKKGPTGGRPSKANWSYQRGSETT